jgi:hypothetical protein
MTSEVSDAIFNLTGFHLNPMLQECLEPFLRAYQHRDTIKFWEFVREIGSGSHIMVEVGLVDYDDICMIENEWYQNHWYKLSSNDNSTSIWNTIDGHHLECYHKNRVWNVDYIDILDFKP